MKDTSSTSLRADAEEFWPIANGRPRDLFRHASDTIVHAQKARTWPERVRSFSSAHLQTFQSRQD